MDWPEVVGAGIAAFCAFLALLYKLIACWCQHRYTEGEESRRKRRKKLRKPPEDSENGQAPRNI